MAAGRIGQRHCEFFGMPGRMNAGEWKPEKGLYRYGSKPTSLISFGAWTS